MRKICVLIHGCHLQAENLEDIIWGDPNTPGKIGRMAKGLLVAREVDADLIYWGTGCSEKDGLKESEYYFNYATRRATEINRFKGYDASLLRTYFLKRSFLDKITQTTVEELTLCSKICSDEKISNVILVSSPTHIARCLQEALKLRAAGKFPGIEISVRASDTCFANSTPADVVVIEPQHRGDMPKVPYHTTAKGIFPMLRNHALAREFNEEWAALIEKYKQKL